MIDGLAIRFIHIRSPHREALPLVITHGWPGSIVEFLKVIGPLTDPPAHGGDAADAFHVVCPSLTGLRLQRQAGAAGWGVERIAAAWSVLMARLGYGRYGAQGSDWGTSISASIGQQDPDHVAGIHVTPPLAPPDPAIFDDLTERERAALASIEHSAQWDSGYSREHATRPQTIGYALVDSPTALCAWIVEKFWAWTDCDGHPENVLTRDELLDNLMLYWLPRGGASSARLYWESSSRVNEWISGPTTDAVAVPTGSAGTARLLPRVAPPARNSKGRRPRSSGQVGPDRGSRDIRASCQMRHVRRLAAVSTVLGLLCLPGAARAQAIVGPFAPLAQERNIRRASRSPAVASRP